MVSKTKLHQIGKMPIDKAHIKEIFRWTPAKPHMVELVAAVLLFVLTYPVVEPRSRFVVHLGFQLAL